MQLFAKNNLRKNLKSWIGSALFGVLNIAALLLFVWVLKAGFAPLTGQAATGTYKALNFRGTLQNSDGTAVTNGPYELKFTIYDAAAGGTCLYTAHGSCAVPIAKSVTVTNGVFTTMIGDTDNGDNAVTIDFNSTSYWLGVTVGEDAELTPRVRIGSAGYAFNADLLDGLHVSTNGGRNSYVPGTDVFGNLNLTGESRGTYAANSTLYINPASATSTYSLLGLAVGGVEKFKIDASGNFAASGTAFISGSGTSTFLYGAALATSGGSVGIGTSTPDQKLTVVGSISNPITQNSGIRQVGTISLDSPAGVFVSGRYAYVTELNTDKLAVVDVSNPLAPAKISTVSVGNNPKGIDVFGNYAYMVNADATSDNLSIVDISNPKVPVHVATSSVGISPQGVHISGRYAYVTFIDGLVVIDISNPSAPKKVSTVTTTGSSSWGIDISGRYAYVVNDMLNTISVIDISNPLIPRLTATTAVGSSPYGISVSGRYAYVANADSGNVSVVDISNPSAPVQVTTVTTGGVPYGISVSGRYAYVTNLSGYVSTIDILNPLAPRVVATTVVAANSSDIFVSGRYAYVVDSSTLSIIDISGAEFSSLVAGSAEIGNLQSRNDIIAGGSITANTSLFAGMGGIISNGALSINSTTTPSYFGA
ncbi:MAG: hypothetical protein WC459_00680, partial [Patescibacteria group bacterium]